MQHEARITKLRQKVDALDIDALLVTDLTNVRYLTGFSGSNGQVLVTASNAYFFSDGRYAARAADLVQGAEIEIYGARLTEVLGPRLSSAGASRLGIESATMTIADRDDLADRLDGVELVPGKTLVESLRRVKDADEVAALRSAIGIADAAFSWLLSNLGTGRSERDIALDLEIWMRQHGADEISFDPIVGSGPLSAHIHHTPSNRIFEKGDLVLLDFGALEGRLLLRHDPHRRPWAGDATSSGRSTTSCSPPSWRGSTRWRPRRDGVSVRCCSP